MPCSFKPAAKTFSILTLVLALLAVVTAAAAAPQNSYTPKSASEHWIKIDKHRLRLHLYKGHDVVKTYPIAIGRGVGTKKSRTDLITPSGVFKIWRVVQDATQLVYDPAWFGEPGEPYKGAYGAKLISFYNPWQIAIHGTNAPGSIGKRVTHGCVRLHNRDIVELSKYVNPGMRLWIVERAAEKDAI